MLAFNKIFTQKVLTFTAGYVIMYPSKQGRNPHMKPNLNNIILVATASATLTVILTIGFCLIANAVIFG